MLSEGSGMPVEDYLALGIFEPLGMSSTYLQGSPAKDIYGSLLDLLAFGRELLNPCLISRSLYEVATTVAFPGLAGVLPGIGRFERNDWGLGVEIKDGKEPHWTGIENSRRTFGHFGGSGTFLWVDPVAGLACAALTDRDFEEWGMAYWPTFSDAVLAEWRGRNGLVQKLTLGVVPAPGVKNVDSAVPAHCARRGTCRCSCTMCKKPRGVSPARPRLALSTDLRVGSQSDEL